MPTTCVCLISLTTSSLVSSFNHSELIEDVNVANNELTEIGIPTVAPVKKLNISGNYFTLANMPNDFGLSRGNFIYAPQHVLQISTLHQVSTSLNSTSQRMVLRLSLYGRRRMVHRYSWVLTIPLPMVLLSSRTLRSTLSM